MGMVPVPISTRATGAVAEAAMRCRRQTEGLCAMVSQALGPLSLHESLQANAAYHGRQRLYAVLAARSLQTLAETLCFLALKSPPEGAARMPQRPAACCMLPSCAGAHKSGLV